MSNSLLYHEAEVLLRVSQGEELAFRELFDHYRMQVYSFAHSLTHSDILAQEITQEVFIKVWEKKHQLAAIQYFSTWIKTIARNAVYSHFRNDAVKRRVFAEINTASETIDPYRRSDNLDLEQKIREAIHSLTPEQQNIYRLSREENMSYAEIAERLGISIHTVKYHLGNVFRILREKLGVAILIYIFYKNLF